jgi:hypothetical protein
MQVKNGELRDAVRTSHTPRQYLSRSPELHLINCRGRVLYNFERLTHMYAGLHKSVKYHMDRANAFVAMHQVP